MIEQEIVPFLGWDRTLRMSNGAVELVVTLDVGPRIISFRTKTGRNVFKIFDAEAGHTGEEEWRIRGGHRLWAAPEDPVSTYELDNLAVSHEAGTETALFTNPKGAVSGLAKELRVRLHERRPCVEVVHTLRNEGSQPCETASWGLTVMPAGAREIIPLPPVGAHPRDLLPNRLMVAWPYTDLTDPRWRFGRRFIRLDEQAGHAAPTKLGLAHTEGWVGCHSEDALFLKTVEHDADASYPDLGCNFETFTTGGMLEVETLGPLATLAPGQSTSHTECWWLFDAPETPPDGEEDLAQWLSPFLAQAELRENA